MYKVLIMASHKDNKHSGKDLPRKEDCKGVLPDKYSENGKIILYYSSFNAFEFHMAQYSQLRLGSQKIRKVIIKCTNCEKIIYTCDGHVESKNVVRLANGDISCNCMAQSMHIDWKENMLEDTLNNFKIVLPKTDAVCKSTNEESDDSSSDE